MSATFTRYRQTLLPLPPRRPAALMPNFPHRPQVVGGVVIKEKYENKPAS